MLKGIADVSVTDSYHIYSCEIENKYSGEVFWINRAVNKDYGLKKLELICVGSKGTVKKFLVDLNTLLVQEVFKDEKEQYITEFFRDVFNVPDVNVYIDKSDCADFHDRKVRIYICSIKVEFPYHFYEQYDGKRLISYIFQQVLDVYERSY